LKNLGVALRKFRGREFLLGFKESLDRAYKHGDNGLEFLFVGRLRHGSNHYRGRDHCHKSQGDEKVMHCGPLSVSMRQPAHNDGSLGNTRQALVEFFSNVTLHYFRSGVQHYF
jgi:hypothetical protein